MPDRPGTATVDEDLATIREDAAAWILSLDEASPGQREDLEARCEAWQAADPRRRRVLRHMREMWSAVEPARHRSRRRAGILGGLALFAILTTALLPWQVWTADYRTAAGEIRDITLPDGSTVVLNTNSAIDVEYSDDRRRISLERGELLVTVRQDAAGRPFRVTTGQGAASALGTRYSVRLAADHTVVTVYESTVRLQPGDSGEPGRTLGAGQRARLKAAAVTGVGPAPRGLPDWAARRLVFNDTPLAEVVERLERYRPGWLMLAGGLTGRGMRFTGVVPADDSDAALGVLADAMALRVRRITPYLVWLEPGG